MSIKLIEGFDHYNDATEFQRKAFTIVQTTASFQFAQTGRFSGYSIDLYNPGTTAAKTLSFAKVFEQTSDTVYMGFALKTVNLIANLRVHLLDESTNQVGLLFASSKTISIVQDTNVLGTIPLAFLDNSWIHVAAEFYLHGSAGTAKLWINGALVANLTNLDTLGTANAYVNGIKVDVVPNTSQNVTVIAYLDDLYVGDDSGPFNTSCPGDRKVYTIYPTGNGTTADWTASAGNDYECVDEAAPDDDTTYISSSTLDQEGLFTFADLAATVSSVHAVQISHYSRKDDATERALVPIIRSGGSNYEEGSDQALGSTYAFYTQIVEDDPQDSAAWTPAKVNAAEFGVKVAV